MTDQFDRGIREQLKSELQDLSFSGREKADLVSRLTAAGNDRVRLSFTERLNGYWNGYTEVRLFWLAGAAGLALVVISSALGTGDPGTYSAVLGAEAGRGFQNLAGGVSTL